MKIVNATSRANLDDMVGSAVAEGLAAASMKGTITFDVGCELTLLIAEAWEKVVADTITRSKAAE